ncbi:MAG: FitA-like ribbon-helix-helix domain-containing protein [Luteolibacter sp.]
MSTSITIRNLDEQVKQRLRVIAAQHGKSMEAEARDILTRAAYAVSRAPGQKDAGPPEDICSAARGKWKHLGITTDEIMALTRGD